jgi:hypothetical protein
MVEETKVLVQRKNRQIRTQAWNDCILENRNVHTTIRNYGVLYFILTLDATFLFKTPQLLGRIKNYCKTVTLVRKGIGFCHYNRYSIAGRKGHHHTLKLSFSNLLPGVIANKSRS